METQQNSTILSTDSEFMVSLINNEDLVEELGDDLSEAEASIFQNPAVSWAKFVLTDDQPNINKQRVPEEEFDNLIKSGIFMPIKMARGQISPGHDKTEPLGVITNLKRSGNKIVALAALWKRERAEDVEYLKALDKNKKPINISWEILYDDFRVSEDGVQDLLGLTLKAATVVGMPAYTGRTQMLAMAAAWSKPYLAELPDENFLIVNKANDSTERLFPYKDKDGKIDLNQLNVATTSLDNSGLSEALIKKTKKEISKIIKEANSSVVEEKNNLEVKTVDELEVYKARVEELTATLTDTKSKLATAEEALVEKETALEEVQPKLEELKELQEYKETVEKVQADTEKYAEIKQKFADAKIEKDEAYFEEHKDFLLALNPEALDFTIQELVSFAGSSVNGKKGAAASSNVPNITSTSKVDTKAIVEALRQRDAKK